MLSIDALSFQKSRQNVFHEPIIYTPPPHGPCQAGDEWDRGSVVWESWSLAGGQGRGYSRGQQHPSHHTSYNLSQPACLTACLPASLPAVWECQFSLIRQIKSVILESYDIYLFFSFEASLRPTTNLIHFPPLPGLLTLSLSLYRQQSR